MINLYEKFCTKLTDDYRLEAIEGTIRTIRRKKYMNSKEFNEIVVEVRFINNTPKIKSSSMYCVYFEEECELIRIENSINGELKIYDRNQINNVIEYVIKIILKGEPNNDKEEFNLAN